MAEREPRGKFVLFDNQRNKKQPNYPDFKGPGEIPVSQLTEIYEWAQAHAGVTEIPIQVAGWNRVSKKNGNQFISCQIELDTRRVQKEDDSPV